MTNIYSAEAESDRKPFAVRFERRLAHKLNRNLSDREETCLSTELKKMRGFQKDSSFTISQDSRGEIFMILFIS